MSSKNPNDKRSFSKGPQKGVKREAPTGDKSRVKIKKEGTQEFFAKDKSDSYTFNKAPINKSDAKRDILDEAAKPKKRSAFMANLYANDDEAEDIKTIIGDQFENPEGAEDNQSKPRDQKSASKGSAVGLGNKNISSSKVGRLALIKGSVAMFAVCEVQSGAYAVVNHTRNVKGFISLKEMPIKLRVGQLVLASVTSVGKNVHQADASNKMQLSLEPSSMYRSFTSEKVTAGMFFQGVVESCEEKGYFINLGFKDNSKGFLKYKEEESDTSAEFEKGDLIMVQAMAATGKLIKVERISQKTVQSSDQVIINEHVLQPGFLVSAKVATIFENGIGLTFLGGMQGTIFADHCGRELAKFKVGEKLQARVISHDISSKKTGLSLLPHITQMTKVGFSDVSVGQVFEKVKVDKVMYGDSFQVKLGPKVTGFLHKMNQKTIEDLDEAEAKKVVTVKDIEKGSTLDKVRVKELNHFDGVPFLTMRRETVGSAALDYASLEVGQFVNATIEKVQQAQQSVLLRLNQFVRGQLRIEHMAEGACKQIPAKFTQADKQIKVRIFAIEGRSVTFTKKDALMKHDVPIFHSLEEVKKGDTVVGVVVAKNEQGFIVRSFGEVKGFISIDEEKLIGDKAKMGTVVKARVTRVKAGKGLSLTLVGISGEQEQAGDEDTQTTFADYLPNDAELKDICDLYHKAVKHSDEDHTMGKNFTFKIVEAKQNYYIVQSVLEKKEKIAILPKPLATAFGVSLPLDDPEFTFEGHIFDHHQEKLPICSFNSVLDTFKQQTAPSKRELKSENSQMGRVFLGLVDSVDSKLGVSVRFPPKSFTKQIAVKDLQHTSNLDVHYPVGCPIRCAFNKQGRLSCKNIVLQRVQASISADEQAKDTQAMLEQFSKLHEASTFSGELKVGKHVKATVQLVKEYGLIVQLAEGQAEKAGLSSYTGFIVNGQRNSDKKYKEGQEINCVLLDVDNDKQMLDLSERLCSVDKSAASKIKENAKAVVEVVKENYMIVSMKADRTQFAVCLIQQSINDLHMAKEYEKYSVGDELDVKLQIKGKDLIKTSSGLLLASLKQAALPQTGASMMQSQTVKEGFSIMAIVKSVKDHCLFAQVGMKGKMPMIGRLHRIETQGEEFATFKTGDRVQVKVLKVTEDQGRTMIELTRRQEHLKTKDGVLDQGASTLLNLDSVKPGQQVRALITDVTADSSNLLQVQISPFVHGQVIFSDLLSAEDLQKQSVFKLLKESPKFKIGKYIDVYYMSNGGFSTNAKPERKAYQKGDLVPVRFVSSRPGYGCTVQLDQNTFGTVQVCELSDEITCNLIPQMQAKAFFNARVIDTNKQGRLMLSARQSVLDRWDTIYSGSSAAFANYDKQNQAQGNLRNKILKFGSKLALAPNDLFTGYVTNISKAGCFVQIGHNCTARIGLNELFDDNDQDSNHDSDFQSQMPIGRQVCGRVTRVINDIASGEMRFNASLRRSLAVHGVAQIKKNELKSGQDLTCFVLAVAKNQVFAQIKGSYLKVQVDKAPAGVKAGQLIDVKLTKVSADATRAEFMSACKDAELDQSAELAQSVYDSILEEAQKDIAQLVKAQKSANDSKKTGGEIDIQAEVENRRQLNTVDQQISDLKTLQELQEQEQESQDSDSDAGQEDDSDAEMGSDSDAELMAKIDSKHHNDEDSDEEQDDEESGEAEDAEMQSIGDSDSDEEMEGEQEEGSNSDDSDKAITTGDKKLRGKAALKANIAEEKKIRAKEASMRKKGGSEPTTIGDFERLLVQDSDQSYLWIQYIAFVLEHVDVDGARKIAERGVKQISITADNDKLNLWIAYMNMEAQYGSDESLAAITKRALDVNDRQKVYLQLVQIYLQMDKIDLIEDIYKKLAKKYHESLEIWGGYLKFCFDQSQDPKSSATISAPKAVLQRSLQALPKSNHVNIISKYALMEFKAGNLEAGRTMFEGIIANYPSRMDIWAIYMDQEVKYATTLGKKDSNKQAQARNLFERALSLPEITKKPKKMKLAFRKYMEFEQALGNVSKLGDLKKRVELYLSTQFNDKKDESSDEEQQAPIVEDDSEEGSDEEEAGSGSAEDEEMAESGEEEGEEESDD